MMLDAIVLTLLTLVVLIAGSAFARSIMYPIRAELDLYTILSFEFTVVDEILTKTIRSSSPHLKRYLNSWVWQKYADMVMRRKGIDPKHRQKYMLIALIEAMVKFDTAEAFEESCTLEWLDANTHRLRSVSQEIFEHWYCLAREFEQSPPHTHHNKCERCDKEEALGSAIFVRKLPLGDDPPTSKLQKMIIAAQPAV